VAEIIRMPEVLAGTTEAAVQTWCVAPGDVIAMGAPFAEIETDKAVVEYAAESSGTVGRLLAAEGENVSVGDPIAVLVGEGESEADIDAALAAAGVQIADVAAVNGSSVAAPAPAAGAPEPEPRASAPGRQFASPLVRRLAKESDIDLTEVAGSGPRGRVVRRDLERHLRTLGVDGRPSAAPPAPGATPGAPPTPGVSAEVPAPDAAGFVDIPLDRMRRAIARRLTESKTTVPHFYLTAHCRVDELLALRARVNETSARRVSVNDFVLKAVAGALVAVPEANSIWNGDTIRRFDRVDLAVAVATDGGLLTPVVRDVARTPLGEVSASVAELAERARSGRIRQHELEGGSFAVSNLGMYGTASFSAILNPPQSGILAVGAAQRRPVVDDRDELVVATVMTVTLSADHRVLDGAVAAQWLTAFQSRIENPLSILV
jgi:pyruvate dehydrogenase E2 component (dihydrolipoamide acetyltransferase)